MNDNITHPRMIIWSSCFDTGSINVHDWWATAGGWRLIIKWLIGVMTLVPLPQKMMTHHYTLSMGDKWVSCFDTGCINVHDWWASEWWLILRWWMGVMSQRQLLYFDWMVQNITKHRPIDLYNVNSQQE